MQRIGGHLVLVEPQTALSRRVVPVPSQTLAALRAHRTRQHADNLAVGATRLDSDLVSATHVGGPLEPRNMNRSWYAVWARAGLDGVRLDDLRYAYASFLLAAGASPRTVMKTLGHSRIGLTMNTYTHVLPEIERSAVDAAADATSTELDLALAALLAAHTLAGARTDIRTRMPDVGAGERDRTADLPFTRRPLCQLSYTGETC
jgi:integrase